MTHVCIGLDFLFTEKKKKKRVYAEYLGNKLPRIEGGAVKLKEGEEKGVCFAVNTAEYCSSNTEALSTTIKNYIDSEIKVDMTAEQERYQSLVAKVRMRKNGKTC